MASASVGVAAGEVAVGLQEMQLLDVTADQPIRCSRTSRVC